MGEEGWDGMWRVERRRLIPRKLWSMAEVALGNQGCPQSREHLGTPKPKSSVHQEQRHILLHEPLRALLGMLGLTGDLGISQLAQQGDTTPRSAKASSQRGWGWLSHSVPTGTHP